MTQPLFDQDRCQMICLLGTNGAGKTSSLKVLKTDQLTSTQSTPVVNFQSYTWSSSPKEVNHLRIWDCSGFTQIKSLAYLHVKRSRGVLIFYNCYMRNTFNDLDLWIDLALSQKISKERICIVRTQFQTKQKEGYEESVTESQGIQFAQKRGVQHRTLKEYKPQNVKAIYEEFGNKIINSHLQNYFCQELIRRSVSYIEKIPPEQSKTDTYIYFGLGSFLLGLVVVSAIKSR